MDVRPFDAANWTSVIVLKKGVPTTYPVPYVKWKPRATGRVGWDKIAQRRRPTMSMLRELPCGGPTLVGNELVPPYATKIEMLARPIDADRPTSPWIVAPANGTINLRVRPDSRADYTAHLGANSGGANAVYWLDVQDRGAQGIRICNRVGKAKRAVPCVEAVIEPDLVYPLVRWADVARWSARPSGYLLLAQDPATRAGIDEERMRRIIRGRWPTCGSLSRCWRRGPRIGGINSGSHSIRCTTSVPTRWPRRK